MPVMSEGIMSGVNWMRRNDRLRILATVLTSSVLASPGTPTSRTWPRANRPVRSCSTTSSWPMITLPISRRRALWLSARAATAATSSREGSGCGVAVMGGPLRGAWSWPMGSSRSGGLPRIEPFYAVRPQLARLWPRSLHRDVGPSDPRRGIRGLQMPGQIFARSSGCRSDRLDRAGRRENGGGRLGSGRGMSRRPLLVDQRLELVQLFEEPSAFLDGRTVRPVQDAGRKLMERVRRLSARAAMSRRRDERSSGSWRRAAREQRDSDLPLSGSWPRQSVH